MPDLTLRLAVVGVLVLVMLAGTLAWRRRQGRAASGPAEHPPVPAALLDGAARTWLVFTTPWCASCGPATDRLREIDPAARFVTVDATVEPDLAGAFYVRSAPTALLADGAGAVRQRLVGAEAVERYVAGSRSPR